MCGGPLSRIEKQIDDTDDYVAYRGVWFDRHLEHWEVVKGGMSWIT